MKKYGRLIGFTLALVVVLTAFCTVSFAAADYTSLLLHFDGVNGSNSVTDSSLAAKTVTVNGNVRISSEQSKFGGTSAYFDGSGGYLTIADAPDLNFGSEDFIIDIWFMPMTDGDMTFYEKRYINNQYGACEGIVISRVNKKLQVNISTNQTSWNVAANTVIGTGIDTGVWNHIIVTRQGNKIFGVVNGVKGNEVAITGAFPSNTNSVKIGNYSLNYNKINGYIDEIKIQKGVSYQQNSIPQNLVANGGNSVVNLSWDAVLVAASYTVKRSSTQNGPYDTVIASNITDTHFADESVMNGGTYYYVVTATVDGIEGGNSNEASATPISPSITFEIASADKAKVKDEIIADVVIHNATNICAEDIKIYYDNTRLQYLGTVNVDGIRIFKEDATTGGAIRFITASLGKENAANGDKILIKLKFKAIAKGEALIDITSGRIADNATLEMDVEGQNCGEKTVLIEGIKDVNRTEQYTLLDLGIDAWYYGHVAADTDTEKYDADQVEDGIIDDADLVKIVELMLQNPDYPVPANS